MHEHDDAVTGKRVSPTPCAGEIAAPKKMQLEGQKSVGGYHRSSGEINLRNCN